MQQIQKFLNCPLERENRNIWLTGCFYGIAVFMLLALLQPFGINETYGIGKYIRLIPFGVATCLSVVGTCFLLKFIAKDFFNSEKWNVKKEIVFNIATVSIIAICNLAIFVIEYDYGLNKWIVWCAIWQTFAIAACVIGLRLLLGQKNVSVSPNTVNNSTANRTVTIKGTGKNDLLTIPASELLYIESDKNYCKVTTTDKTLQIRLTITSAEEQLADSKQFIRCHRAYIVNRDKVISIDGSATTGYKLILSGTETNVPIGRSYTDNFNNIISKG